MDTKKWELGSPDMNQFYTVGILTTDLLLLRNIFPLNIFPTSVLNGDILTCMNRRKINKTNLRCVVLGHRDNLRFSTYYWKAKRILSRKSVFQMETLLLKTFYVIALNVFQFTPWKNNILMFLTMSVVLRIFFRKDSIWSALRDTIYERNIVFIPSILCTKVHRKGNVL